MAQQQANIQAVRQARFDELSHVFEFDKLHESERQFYTACFWGDLAKIKQLKHLTRRGEVAKHGICFAAEGNQTECFIYIHEQGADIQNRMGEDMLNTSTYAIGRNNNIELAAYVINHAIRKQYTAVNIISGALDCGSVELFERMQQMTELDFSKQGFERYPITAAQNGFLNIIQKFEELGGTIPFEDTAIAAAKGGHLDIIEYLFNNPENEKYFNPYGIYFQPTRNTILTAVAHSQNHVVEFFNERWPEKVGKGFEQQMAEEYFGRAFENAYKADNLPLLRFFCEKTALDINNMNWGAVNWATAKENVDTARYFLQHHWQQVFEESLNLRGWSEENLIKLLTLPFFVQNPARLHSIERVLKTEHPDMSTMSQLKHHIGRQKARALLYFSQSKRVPRSE